MFNLRRESATPRLHEVGPKVERLGARDVGTRVVDRSRKHGA
jgi:hypothetical protein